jgi:hypothetical protein
VSAHLLIATTFLIVLVTARALGVRKDLTEQAPTQTLVLVVILMAAIWLAVVVGFYYGIKFAIHTWQIVRNRP